MQSSIHNHQSDASYLHGCQLGLQRCNSRLRFTQCTLCPHSLTAAEASAILAAIQHPRHPHLDAQESGGGGARQIPAITFSRSRSNLSSCDFRRATCSTTFRTRETFTIADFQGSTTNSSTPLSICQRAGTTSLQRPPTLWEMTVPCVPAL